MCSDFVFGIFFALNSLRDKVCLKPFKYHQERKREREREICHLCNGVLQKQLDRFIGCIIRRCVASVILQGWVGPMLEQEHHNLSII